VAHAPSGLTDSVARVYRIWVGMRDRCNNDRSGNYGARGIRFCDRWQCFENFLADMGEPPTFQHSIDRINNDGNYEPGNCRWATRTEQSRNQRSNTILEFRGEKVTLAEWSERMGIKASTLCVRLYKLCWTIEQSLTTPVLVQSPRHDQEREIVHDWLTNRQSFRRTGERHGFSHHTVKRILERNGAI
jgi:hypothetical protein